MWSILFLFAVGITVLLKTKWYRWPYILILTHTRDVRAALAFIKLQLQMRCLQKHNRTVGNGFALLARKHPEKVAFYFEEESCTFAEADNFANKIAKYFKEQGFKKGDSIALILENRPEYPCMWLGLSKIGVITALLNTNLVKDSLVHCLKVANCKAIIFGSVYRKTVEDILPKIESIKLYQFNESAKDTPEVLSASKDLKRDLKDIPDGPLENVEDVSVYDPLMYIYTSGTTGLPKAAVVTNLRFSFVACGIFIAGNFTKDDILYSPLPLYHAAGIIIGLGTTLVKGVTSVIRKKFSASNYFSDCEKYKCTYAQYIGEMCRYILAVPHAKPVKHSLKAILGSGLKPQIWNEFVKRFDIKQVYEYYGATEGVSNLFNTSNVVGSVGFVPRYAKHFYPVTLIKCNEDTGKPIRDKNGRCIPCEIDEPGLVIGKVNRRTAIFNFKGYCDEKATEEKILRDVFTVGDQYFNSGDILVSDEFGNFYFRDRTGDTFRWKGENVSTTEVEAVVSNLTKLNDAVAYGVQIPGTEGRAGMVALADPEKIADINSLYKGLKASLPSYAVPIFIRVMESVPLTGTFKLKKNDLQKEGYDITKVKDSIYFYDSRLKKCVILSNDLYEEIINEKLRL